MEKRKNVSSLIHNNFETCCVHHVVATISWPISAEFHCYSVHDPEFLSWSSRCTKALAPCCKSMVPSYVSLKFRYTKWQSEAVHSFTVPFFSNVSTTYCTQPCPYLHCSQYELPFLVSINIRKNVLLDLLSFSKWTVSLDWLNSFWWRHNCVTLLEMFSSY